MCFKQYFSWEKDKIKQEKTKLKIEVCFFFKQFLQNLPVEAMLNIELILDSLIQRNKERFYSMKTMPHFNFSTLSSVKGRFIFLNHQKRCRKEQGKTEYRQSTKSSYRHNSLI